MLDKYIQRLSLMWILGSTNVQNRNHLRHTYLVLQISTLSQMSGPASSKIHYRRLLLRASGHLLLLFMLLCCMDTALIWTHSNRKTTKTPLGHSPLSLRYHSSWKPQPVLLAALCSTLFSDHMCWRDTVPSKPQIRKTNANLFCIFERCFSLPILP